MNRLSLSMLSLLVFTKVSFAAGVEVTGRVEQTTNFTSNWGESFRPTTCAIHSSSFQHELKYSIRLSNGVSTANESFQFYSGSYGGLPEQSPVAPLSLHAPDHLTALFFQDGALTLKTSRTSRSIDTGIAAYIGPMRGQNVIVLNTAKTVVRVIGTQANIKVYTRYLLLATYPVLVSEANCTLESPLFR